MAFLKYHICQKSLEEMPDELKILLNQSGINIHIIQSCDFEKKFYLLPNMKLIPSYFEPHNILKIHKGELYFNINLQ